MYQLFFDAESIYEISKLYLNKFCNGRMDGRTHRAESNMPLQIFQQSDFLQTALISFAGC